MKKQFTCFRKYIISLLCLLFILQSNLSKAQDIQYLEDWVQITSIPDNFFNNSVSVLDVSNNLYTASSVLNTSSNYDLLLTKTDHNGNLLWSQTFNVSTAGDALAGGITLDNSNNIYICGSVYNGTNEYDALIIKYNNAGVQQWYQLYNGAASFHDGLRGIVWDATTDAVYLSGSSFETSAINSDFLTLAYSSSGTALWNKQFDGVGSGLYDAGNTASIISGALVISGPAQSTANTWEYVCKI